MGKRLIIVAFLLCFGLAVYIFFQRDKTTLRQTIDTENKREPRIVMEEFTLYRYEEARLQNQLSSRLGQIFEPNIVELDGEIKGERQRNGQSETFNAETATLTFDAKSLNKMMEGTELSKAEMNGFIEVAVKDHVLSTDYAVYLASGNLLKSNRPVRVDGPNRVFTGDDGFIYRITQESLVMLGTVKGVFKPDEKK